MSSTAEPHYEASAEEELVAYLDGELAPEECRRIEARLAADDRYRQQLRALDKAWEVLDALPATRGDDQFARTTMEMVALAAESDLSQHAARMATATRRRMLWFALIGAAGVLVGFLVARYLLSRRDAALLADLPVIRQVDLLAHVDSVEFLRRLPENLPVDHLTTGSAALRDELLNLQWINAPELEDRKVWLDALANDEKARLLAQADRFRTLPADEQDRLRRLEREIRQADDAEVLQQNLLAYGQWLARLSLGEQQELKESLHGRSLEEQMEHVRRLARKENQRASRRLSPEDSDSLRRAVLNFAEERKPRIEGELRRRGRRDAARWLEHPRAALMILGRELQSDDPASHLREIVNELSPEARAHLQQLGPWARRLQLWQWIRDSLKPNWTPGELERFFAEELNSDQRLRLLNLSSSQMEAELERLYLASEFGVRNFGAGFGMPDRPPPNRPEFDLEFNRRGHPLGPPPPDVRERGRFQRPPSEAPPPHPGDGIGPPLRRHRPAPQEAQPQ
jgi:hypothetical protein